MSRPPRTRRPAVCIVPVGATDPALAGRMADALGGVLSLPVRTGAPLALADEWRDPVSARYASGPVVDALQGAARPGEWILGVAEAALRGPDGRAVFGEAAVGGAAAVVALAPLREGGGGDPGVFCRRVLTEAVHELGHVAGLAHCHDGACVMFSSADIADTDRKGPGFCPRCAPLAGFTEGKA